MRLEKNPGLTRPGFFIWQCGMWSKQRRQRLVAVSPGRVEVAGRSPSAVEVVGALIVWVEVVARSVVSEAGPGTGVEVIRAATAARSMAYSI